MVDEDLVAIAPGEASGLDHIAGVGGENGRSGDIANIDAVMAGVERLRQPTPGWPGKVSGAHRGPGWWTANFDTHIVVAGYDLPAPTRDYEPLAGVRV